MSITIKNNCQAQIPQITQEISNFTTQNESKSVINVASSTITGNTIYESTSLKNKEIAKYLTMVILTGVLVWMILTTKKTEKELKKNGIYNKSNNRSFRLS